MSSVVENCREYEPLMRRIIENTDNDETLLFEALNLYDELQQVLSKHKELDPADPPPPNVQVVDGSTIASPQRGNPLDGEGGQKTLGSEKTVRNDNGITEKE